MYRVFKHWQRWKKEYLVSLREYNHVHKGTESEIRVHRVVLIENKMKKNRLTWKLGRVTDLILVNDDQVRGARVRIANGNIIKRPLQKLYPFEISEYRRDAETKPEGEIIHEGYKKRPQRQAARIAKESINDIDQLKKYQRTLGLAGQGGSVENVEPLAPSPLLFACSFS